MEPRERWGAGKPDSARVPGATAATMSCSREAYTHAATMSCSGAGEGHGETAPRRARGPGGVGFERRQAGEERDLPDAGAS